jgi:hypothetical protein
MTKPIIIYFYKTKTFQTWKDDQLIYEGPSYQMALDAIIPF